MEHVVFFPAHDGTPAFRRVSNLEDAVRLVEHLRNVENVAELSVHALTEVPMAFKTFYRVELPTDAPEAVAEAPVVEVPGQEVPPPLPVASAVDELTPVADELPEPPADDDVPVPALAAVAAPAAAPAEDAPSSLGFFAS
jgi:hypothetical protein